MKAARYSWGRLLLTAALSGGCTTLGNAPPAPDASVAGKGGEDQPDTGSATEGVGMSDSGVTPPKPDAALPREQDSGTDAATPTPAPATCATDEIDVLLVMDRSNSMGDQRLALAGQLNDFLSVLESGDVSGDGKPEFKGFRSIRVGIITSDLGVIATSQFLAMNCPAPADDAALQAKGDATLLGCAPIYSPAYASFEAGTGNRQLAANQLECIIRGLVSGGCGYEQPLEAALRAVSNGATPWGFSVGAGQADAANAGFLRENAILAVVVISDEDDCSFRDVALADVRDPKYPVVAVNARCGLVHEALSPLARYYHGLRSRKPNAPHKVVFGAIAGVPEDLTKDGDSAKYRAALKDPRMVPTVDNVPSVAPQAAPLKPACMDAAGATADPAPRLVELAALFEDSGSARSICARSVQPALHAIAERAGHAAEKAQCEADECPCQAPFRCENKHCVCDGTFLCTDGDVCQAPADGCGTARACGDCSATRFTTNISPAADGGVPTSAPPGCTPKTFCPLEACGLLDNGCGLLIDCGSCTGTLKCGLKQPNQCAADTACPANHVCATVHAPSDVVIPKGGMVIMLLPPDFTQYTSTTKPLQQWIIGTAPTRDAQGNYRVDYDVSNWPATASAHIGIALTWGAANLPLEAGDLSTFTTTPLEIAPGRSYELGSRTLYFNSLPPDNLDTVGHDAAGVIQCTSACPYFCCKNAGTTTCEASCPSVGDHIGCDGPEDCNSSTVCCEFPHVADQSTGIVVAYGGQRCTPVAEACPRPVCHTDNQCPASMICLQGYCAAKQ